MNRNQLKQKQFRKITNNSSRLSLILRYLRKKLAAPAQPAARVLQQPQQKVPVVMEWAHSVIRRYEAVKNNTPVNHSHLISKTSILKIFSDSSLIFQD